MPHIQIPVDGGGIPSRARRVSTGDSGATSRAAAAHSAGCVVRRAAQLVTACRLLGAHTGDRLIECHLLCSLQISLL